MGRKVPIIQRKIRVIEDQGNPGLFHAFLGTVRCEGPSAEIALAKAEVLQAELHLQNRKEILASLKRALRFKRSVKPKENANA